MENVRRGFPCDSNSPELYQCELCKFVTDVKVNLTVHQWMLHEGKLANSTYDNMLRCYWCVNCAFMTNSLLVLSNHIDNSCNSGEHRWYEYESPKECKILKCRYCPYQSVWKSNMKSHIVNRHTDDKDIKWFKCEQCAYRTKYSKCINLHKLWKHTDAKDVKNWFECEECPFKTKLKAALKTHVLSKHSTCIKWFECGQCTFKAKLKSRLNKHIAVKHVNPEDIDWIKCPHCPMKIKATLKWDLKKHIIAKHTNPEDIHWHKCGQCSFKAKLKTQLNVHLRKHFTECHKSNKLDKL